MSGGWRTADGEEKSLSFTNLKMRVIQLAVHVTAFINGGTMMDSRAAVVRDPLSIILRFVTVRRPLSAVHC